MGRTALLIILALAVAFGYIGSSIRGASRILMEAHAGYLSKTNAHNLARLGVHRILRYKDGQAMDPSLRHPINPGTVAFNGGYYMVDTSYSAGGNTLSINSVGTFGDTIATIRAIFLLTQRPIPAAAGAIGINTQLITFNAGNNVTIDGNNHDSTGTSLTGSGNLPGVTVSNATDTSTVRTGTTKATVAGSPDITLNTNQEDPQTYLDTYEANATYRYDKTNPPPTGATFGSWTNPTIVTVNPQGDTTTGVQFSGKTTGYGILVIEGGGTVKFSGQFQWYGLVIVYGVSSRLDFDYNGTGSSGQIVGGLVIAGNSTNTATVDMRGSANCQVLYSSSAIDKARKIAPLTFYRVREWYE